MKPADICLAVCLLGAIVLSGSWYWKNVAGDRTVWTEEDAQQYVLVANKLHHAAHEHGAAQEAQQRGGLFSSMHRPVSDEELAAIQAQWEEQKSKSEAARSWKDLWTNILFGVGALCVGGGGIGFLAVNQMED